MNDVLAQAYAPGMAADRDVEPGEHRHPARWAESIWSPEKLREDHSWNSGFPYEPRG